jgi:hypothetical protein
MTENTTEVQIHALVAAWNKATNQDCNPTRYINQGYTFIEAGVTPDEVTTVARYLILQNNKASEARFKSAVSLYNLMVNLAKFDSILQLAKAHFRNNAPKSAKTAFLESCGRGEGDHPNTRHVSEIIQHLNGAGSH